MGFKGDSPRARVKAVHGPRQVVLFCEDVGLGMELETLFSDKKIGFETRRKVKGDEAKLLKQRTAFLVHMHPQQQWPFDLVEALCKNAQAMSAHLLLITEGFIDEPTQALAKACGLRGYVPRGSLHNVIFSRIEALFRPGEQLRQHPRFRVSIPVSYSLDGRSLRGTCTSLSEGGMFVQSPQSPNVDSSIAIGIYPKGRITQKKYTGKVLYSLPVGFAAKFDSRISDIAAYVSL